MGIELRVKLATILTASLLFCGLLTTAVWAEDVAPGSPTQPEDTEAILLDLTESKVRLQGLPTGMAGMMVEYVPNDGMIYILGGYHTLANESTITLLKEIWRYDPVLDVLSPAGELSVGLALAAHVYVEEKGKIYLFGGIVDGESGPETTHHIYTFDPQSGETEQLSSASQGICYDIEDPCLSARGTAVYVPGTSQIYYFGGTDVSAFSSGSERLRRFDLELNEMSVAMTNSDLGTIFSAHYIPNSWPLLPDPSQSSSVVLQPQGFILLLSSKGYAIFKPGFPDEAIVAFQAAGHLDAPPGLAGAAYAYVPTKGSVLRIGGAYQLILPPEYFVPETYLLSLYDPNSAAQSIDILYDPQVDGETPPPQMYRADAAAVYVPELDRVLLFGGWNADGSRADWLDTPDASQYLQRIYAIGLSHKDTDPYGTDGELLMPQAVGNPVVGTSFDVEVSRPDSSESFAVALQAPFRASNGQVELVTQIQAIVPGNSLGAADSPKVSITVPETIETAGDERSEQVVAVCAISLDRALSANCREFQLTLKPGTLKGTVKRDLNSADPAVESGAGDVVANATVELRDVSGDLVMTTTTGTDGTFNFCPVDHCLAIGTYTVNVWKAEAESDGEGDFWHKPGAIGAEVVASQETDVTPILDVTRIPGPLIKVLNTRHNALAGDEIGTFLSFDHFPASLKAPQVLNTFGVQTLGLNPEQVTVRVDFALDGQTVTDRDGSNGWSAKFDMSTLPAGNNTLTITAYDQESGVERPGESRSFVVKTRKGKPITGPASYVTVGSITWNPRSESYLTSVYVPANLEWPESDEGFPREIDLILMQFYNKLYSQIEIQEEYFITDNWVGEGEAGIFIQLMTEDKDDAQLDYSYGLIPNYTGTEIDSYTIRSERLDLCEYLAGTVELKYNTKKLKLACGEWMPVGKGKKFEKTIKKVPIKGNFTMSMKYQASVVMDGSFGGQSWELSEIRLIPRPELGLKGELVLSTSVWFATVKAGLWGEGNVAADFPIVYRPSSNSKVFLDNPCFNFLVTYGGWLDIKEKAFGSRHKFSFGPNVLLDENVPSGCEFLDIAQKAALRTSADFFEPPNLMPAPVTAVTSQYDDHAILRLWIEDIDPDPDLVEKALAYEVGGVGANYAKTIFYSAVGLADPSVGFLSDTRALAVWSQMDYPESGSSDPEVEELMSYQEIYHAFWNRTENKWSTPDKLTSNSVNDGNPALAVAPDGQALIAWVRDLDGDANTKGDWQVLSRHYDGSTWGPEQEIARDDTAADLEPAIAYNHSGTKAWVVWVRDKDADLTTNKDRRLVYAEWNGTGWDSVQEPATWPVGALHPSIIFTSQNSDRPVVAMIVVDDLRTTLEGEPVEPSGLGTENELYAAWWGPDASAWDVARIGDTRGEWPEIQLISDDRAAILFRSFGGDGDNPSLGQVAAVEGELNRDGARWATLGTLTTSDTEIVWQVNGTMLPLTSPTGNMVFDIVAVNENPQQKLSAARAWENRSPAAVETADHVRATMLGGDTRTGAVNLAPRVDGVILAVEAITVSNSLPASGEIVSVTVQVRNTTIRPLSESGNDLFFIFLLDEQENELARFEYDGDTMGQDLLFNEIAIAQLSYRSTGRYERLTIRLSYANGLADIPDQIDFPVEMGIVPAPGNVNISTELAVLRGQVATGPIYLKWTEPVTATESLWVYRVYSGTSESGPWNLMAQTAETFFTDQSPTDLEGYYAVEAYDQYNHRSPRSVVTLKKPTVLPPLRPGPLPVENGIYLPFINQ